MKATVVSLLAFGLLSLVESKSLVKLLSICKPKDSDFQDCFKKSVEKTYSILKNGDRSLGIVPIDPLDVPYMEIKQPEGPVGISFRFTNAKHYGLSNLKIISSKAMPEKYRFEFKVKIPYYTVSGPYEAKGRILLLPLSGKGMSNITMYDQTADWVIQGKPKRVKGKTYLEIVKYELNIKPDRASFDLTNLFNGEKQISEATLRFMNENNREVIREMGSSLNEAIAQLHGALAQRLFDQLPYDEAFPGL